MCSVCVLLCFTSAWFPSKKNPAAHTVADALPLALLHWISKSSAVIQNRKWQLCGSHGDYKWKLSPLFPVWNKTKKILYRGICGRIVVHVVVLSPKLTCRAHQRALTAYCVAASCYSMMSLGHILPVWQADAHFRCPHTPYLPYLPPCDCHAFGALKEALGGKAFQANEEEQEVVLKLLVKCWRTCAEHRYLSQSLVDVFQVVSVDTFTKQFVKTDC